MRIRIGHLSTFYHTAILLMSGTDTAARLGQDPEWKLMGTGPAIMQAFDAGELDLAYIGLPPAMIGMNRGIDVVCVAGGHMEGTVLAGKSRWAGHAETGDPAAVLGQFRGQTIGVPGRGSIHDVILRDLLDRQGLAQEIGVVNYPWADLVTEAVVHDEVAAAIGTPALAIAISRFAGGTILVPPSLLWPDNPSYGIVVRRAFLEKEQAAVEQFLRLHEGATALLRHEPREAARRISRFINVVDEDFVLDTLRVSPKYCGQLTDEYIAATMRFVPVLQRLGYLDKQLAESRIFDRRSINRLHPEKDHYRDGLAESGF